MRADGAVLALGTFDGVHKGHQAVLKRAVRRARALGLPAVAVTFARPPRLHFAPRSTPSLLTTPEEKASLLSALGVDRVVTLVFDDALARLTAEDFLASLVRRRWKAREVVVGYNFRFGRGRAGDAAFLKRWGAAAGVPVHVLPRVSWRGQRLSSERLRRRLSSGRVDVAKGMLGRPYSAQGKVVTGDARGRALGFPTANVAVDPEKLLPPGVYAVRARLPGGRVRGGMANIGVRPTLAKPDERPGLEVHLFGFSGRLPGKTLGVSFVKRLRAERKFPDLPALRRRLARDAALARAAL